MLRIGSSLKGYGIEANDGGIGTVHDVLFDDITWKMRWLVVDTGNWLTGRRVLIHPSAIGLPDDGRETLQVKLAKARIAAAPDILQDRPVSQQYESDLYDYYGWDPSWGGSYFGPGSMSGALAPLPYFDREMVRGTQGEMAADGFRLDEGDPHLRSLTEITGYHIHASDGAIGHLEDVLIDDATWLIHYLIVDTSNWWLGEHVLISPYAVKEINFLEHEIRIDITRDKVKSSPPWKPVDLIDEAYQRRLHSHYDWPGYGW